MSGRFRAGDVLLERHLFDGVVVVARPVTVIAVDRERLLTWLSPGSEVALPVERIPPYGGIAVREWAPPGMLQVIRPGDPYALALLRNRDGEFAGWYVNLQEPLAWTSAGYDTRENLLDLWRPVDGDWIWKDEDELAAAVANGALTAANADAIRAAADQALRELELPTGWEGWEPEAPLPSLRLPKGWSDV